MIGALAEVAVAQEPLAPSHEDQPVRPDAGEWLERGAGRTSAVGAMANERVLECVLRYVSDFATQALAAQRPALNHAARDLDGIASQVRRRRLVDEAGYRRREA